MDLGGHFDHIKLKAEILSDRTRHVEYLSINNLHRPRKVTRDWFRVKEIGSGAKGVVFLEKANDGALRAVKQIQKSKSVSNYLQELLAMVKLSKDAVFFVQLFGWFDSEHIVYIAMEYFPYGDLYTCYQDSLPEKTVRDVAEQLLEGLARMHELGITHRDLKPQNIFVAQKDPIWVKIGDFGISKLIRDDESALRTSQIGTRGFQAPEILRLLDDAGETSEYTPAVDLWSLGIVLYFLTCRKLPFPGGQLWAYCQRGADFPVSFLQSAGVGVAGIEFLRGLLTPTPTERPTALSALQSNWIVERDNIEYEQIEQNLDSIKDVTEQLKASRIRIGSSHSAADDFDDDQRVKALPALPPDANEKPKSVYELSYWPLSLNTDKSSPASISSADSSGGSTTHQAELITPHGTLKAISRPENAVDRSRSVISAEYLKWPPQRTFEKQASILSFTVRLKESSISDHGLKSSEPWLVESYDLERNKLVQPERAKAHESNFLEKLAQAYTGDPNKSFQRIKPVRLKGLLSVSTTSNKNLHAIYTDIDHVLTELYIQHAQIRGGLDCSSHFSRNHILKFNIYIVEVPLLSSHEIRFNRIEGEWSVCELMATRVLESLRRLWER